MSKGEVSRSKLSESLVMMRLMVNGTYHKPQRTHLQGRYCRVRDRRNLLKLRQMKARIWHTVDNSTPCKDHDCLKKKRKANTIVCTFVDRVATSNA